MKTDKSVRNDWGAQILKLVSAFWAADKIKSEHSTLTLYVDKAMNYPIAMVEMAVDRLIDTSKFFPRIAELIEAIEEVKLGIGESGDTMDSLGKIREELHQKIYRGEFDGSEWAKLRDRYTAIGFTGNADCISAKMEVIIESGGD